MRTTCIVDIASIEVRGGRSRSVTIADQLVERVQAGRHVCELAIPHSGLEAKDNTSAWVANDGRAKLCCVDAPTMIFSQSLQFTTIL